MQIVINNKILITRGKEILVSPIVITKEMLKSLPYYTGDLFEYYKDYVTDFKIYKTRAKKVDEKFLKSFLRRIR